MNLDYHLDNILRAAKFGAVGDKFTLQVSGQGDWNQQDGAPSSAWLKQLLTATGYNIDDANITLVTANPIGFAYGSTYAIWFSVTDELGTGSVTDAFNQLSDVIKPYFDNYTFNVTSSSVTPITPAHTGGSGNIPPKGTGTAPGGTGIKPGVFTTIANDLKIPVAALAIIGFSVFLYLGNRK